MQCSIQHFSTHEIGLTTTNWILNKCCSLSHSSTSSSTARALFSGILSKAWKLIFQSLSLIFVYKMPWSLPHSLSPSPVFICTLCGLCQEAAWLFSYYDHQFFYQYQILILFSSLMHSRSRKWWLWQWFLSIHWHLHLQSFCAVRHAQGHVEVVQSGSNKTLQGIIINTTLIHNNFPESTSTAERSSIIVLLKRVFLLKTA